MSSDAVITEPEPARPVISAFCGNTALNDSETYQTLNLHLNTEPAGLVNPAFRGNTALNDSETDQTMNWHLNHDPDTETYQIMNLTRKLTRL